MSIVDWLRKLTGKPLLSTYTPPPAPKGRAARPAVSTSTRTVQLHVSLFNWHRWGGGKAARPATPGRSLLDLRALDWAFGQRPAAPAADRVQAARQRTAARQRVKRTPAPVTGSRPASAADLAEWRKRVQAREAAGAHREQQVKAAETAPKKGEGKPDVVEGEVVSSKPVRVRAHKRAGVPVDAHTRSAPESETGT